VDVGKLDPGWKGDHALAGRSCGNLGDVDRQRGRSIGSRRIGKRVLEDILDSVRSARIPDVVEIALRIDDSAPNWPET